MKRIFLLIFLVMMAVSFLRHRDHCWEPHDVDAPRPYRLVKGPHGKIAEIEQRRAPSPVDPPIRKITSGMMATEERAKADAIRKLEAEIPEWLSPEIPDSWKPSRKLVRSMIRETTYTPVVKDYGTLYIAELTADTSSRRREAILAEYRREAVQHRMLALGGSLAFVLVCLAAISGYIRADEATKGYYTNRLRMLAAAGVGAAGVVVYRFLA